MPAAKRARSKASTNGKLGSLDVVRKAVQQVAMLTGRQVEGVLGMRRADDGWEVTLEVLELHRIPDSTDVLASYEVALDDHGELREYRRVRRYARNQTEED
jgi:hypothetical protein